jgi:glucosyl-3-phosphoglycerate synthase
VAAIFDLTGWTRERAVQAKAGRTISLCIPCRDEANTIGGLVTLAKNALGGPNGLVDEIIVLDDRSIDGSADVARGAGATVVPISEVHEKQGEGRGKGNALWASLIVSKGDIVVWCDADVTSFEPDWVTRLVAPLLLDDHNAIVKAHYHRPTELGGGGRTTELVARPLLSLFYPELADLHQPLAGEYAVRRSAMADIPFVQGWGVEIAMLIDVAGKFGIDTITQVDLGVRHHRNQPLLSLAVQAAEVIATVLDRAGATASFAESVLMLHRPGGVSQPLNLKERPPISSLK